MTEEFIGDALKPDKTTYDIGRMSAGEPGLPRRFEWRGEPVEIRAVVRTWKETGCCSHGSGEQYVNKHWYELATSHGQMKVYFERRPRRGSRAGSARWWLYSLRPGVETVAVAEVGRPRGVRLVADIHAAKALPQGRAVAADESPMSAASQATALLS
jgi:Family of unknown function (DUF6504)